MQKITGPYFQLPFNDIKCLGLIMVDVWRRASTGRHSPFEHELRPVGLCCGCEKRVYIAGTHNHRPSVCSSKKRHDLLLMAQN